jgi:hypothetical protein
MFASVVTALVLTLTVARYPGDGPKTSASGRFVVANVDLEQKSTTRSHALFVTERRTQARKLLLQYPRDVDVAWAPDRDALAVTSRVGSTQTTLALFTVEDGATFRKLDVTEALYAAFPSLRGELNQYLHVHLQLVRWRPGGAVECQLRASAGSGPNVARKYVVGLDGQAKRI